MTKPKTTKLKTTKLKTTKLKTTKLETWVDQTHALDTDWPPREPTTLTELVAEARALDWDFTCWCYASGYDAGDPDARGMFDRLLAYARHEGRAGLH